ncbi:ABC transporter substrate-binding protein [Vibrio sp. MACH09]|uniref:substrate-binding periplasmic protein n=1 Tax=Vibrio sp. MACH09 TaxID=3025122 RepID=UPI002790708A|nr:transporter substrate-binding domain-containing protein [Vibrio sp. MACH09]GLO61961.1 ABC transporter substrate-binding protein [Vibrio sp. MACH09]
MTNIKITLTRAVLVLFLSFSLQAKEDISVTVYGDGYYPPFSWQQDGRFVGIYPTILRNAFDRMDGYDIKIVPVPWKRGLHILKYGKAFALFPPYYHPKTRPYMSYSVPILEEKTRLVCHKDFFGKSRERWPEDFYGASIGRSLGYLIGGESFQEAIEQKKIKVIELQDSNHNLMLMVGNGRIDCYVDEASALEVELNYLKASLEYKTLAENIFMGPIVNHQRGYLGFTNENLDMYPYKNDFVNKFNQIILDMQNSGDIERVINESLKAYQEDLK